jgi:multidrug efflux pump subunit AcrA (membrane-fusion protein)
MPVSITLPYMRNKIFRGKVSFIYPQINPETRTLKVRVEVENENYFLKPQMYAEARLEFSLGRRLAVSESAVYRTGEREYVFIKTQENHLKPVIVKTGLLSGDGFYEIISGLSGGEEVLSPASFLIDSESSLKAVFKKAHEH